MEPVRISLNQLRTLAYTESLLNYLNIDLTVNDIHFVKGLYGEVAVLSVKLPDGTEKKLRTSSAVVLNQLKELTSLNIPFPWLVKFVKIKRYITIAP